MSGDTEITLVRVCRDLTAYVCVVDLYRTACRPGHSRNPAPRPTPTHTLPGSFGSVRLARRVVTGEGPPYQQYAVKALSKQRLRRMKKSVVTGADGRMVVKTGEDMVGGDYSVDV